MVTTPQRILVMDNNQKQAFAILGGLAAVLLLGQRMNPFAGSYNEDDDDENQYKKALRMMKQRRKANAQRGPVPRSETFTFKGARKRVSDAAGADTFEFVQSSDESRFPHPKHEINDWRRQEAYWDSLNAFGDRKTNLDLIEDMGYTPHSAFHQQFSEQDED